jgi:hypothetical protein
MALSTIMPANSVSGGYEIDNSLRFNDGDTAELTRTPGSESDKQKHTISMWVKRCTSGVNQALFSAGASDQLVYLIRFIDDSLYIQQGGNFVKQTDRLFRDPSAWYHIVVAMDSTQSTLNDRIKIYVNGVLETSFAANTYGGGQNLNLLVNDDVIHAVGYNTLDNATPFDGYISEFHLIDGTQKAASDFGKFDNNNEWIPKAYTGSYGTNGVYLEFKETGTGTNASGMGADTSGNTHHYAPVNLAATDVTTDTPTNNFCTWNPIDKHSGQTLSEGNTKNVAANSASSCNSNFGVSQGKWYFEYKVKVVNAQAVFAVPQNLYAGGTDLFGKNYTTGLYSSNPSIYRNGSNVVSNLNGTISADDIIMWAMDLDNNNIYFGKGGNWTDGNGFDQSDFANATAYPLTRDDADSFVVISTINGASASSYTLEMNWGNPAFAISSGNADANGYGNFEYAPPTGYYSLCTKNLAEFG